MAIDLQKMMDELPGRMRALPVDHRGFPVPWFVQWFDEGSKPVLYGVGTPDFRVIDPARIFQAVEAEAGAGCAAGRWACTRRS